MEYPDPNEIKIDKDPKNIHGDYNKPVNPDHRGKGTDTFFVDGSRNVRACTTRYMGYKGKELLMNRVP